MTEQQESRHEKHRPIAYPDHSKEAYDTFFSAWSLERRLIPTMIELDRSERLKRKKELQNEMDDDSLADAQ